MPQINYGEQPVAVVGQVATYEDAVIDSLTNELLAQVSTLTVGGTASDGTYSVQATGPDGEVLTAEFVRGAGETNAQIATALAAAMSPTWLNAFTIVDGGSGVLTLTANHGGRVYTFITAAPGTGTLVAANTQTAGGVDIQMGVAVAEGSDDDLAAVLSGSTVDDDLAGIVVRGIDGLVNDLGEGGAPAVFQPGSTLSVLRRGEAWVTVEDAVAKGADAFVRIANPAAGDPVGLFRSDADGGDAIEMTGARFASTTTGRGLAKVRINRP